MLPCTFFIFGGVYMKILVITATVCDGKYYAPNTELEGEEEYLNRIVDSGVAKVLSQDVTPKRKGRPKLNK